MTKRQFQNFVRICCVIGACVLNFTVFLEMPNFIWALLMFMLGEFHGRTSEILSNTIDKDSNDDDDNNDGDEEKVYVN